MLEEAVHYVKFLQLQIKVIHYISFTIYTCVGNCKETTQYKIKLKENLKNIICSDTLSCALRAKTVNTVVFHLK